MSENVFYNGPFKVTESIRPEGRAFHVEGKTDHPLTIAELKNIFEGFAMLEESK